MPCWQVQSMSVEFKAAHWDLLEGALKQLKWRFEYVAETKTLTINKGDDWGQIIIQLGVEKSKARLRAQVQPQLNLLKQQYSVQALQRVANDPRRRWKLNFETVGGVAGKGFKGTLQKTIL